MRERKFGVESEKLSRRDLGENGAGLQVTCLAGCQLQGLPRCGTRGCAR